MEDQKLFELVHSSLADILSCKKRGIESVPIIQPLIRAIRSGSEYVNQNERIASGGAVLVASKLLLTSATPSEKIQFINLFSVSIEMIETPKNIPSFRWSNIQSMFMNLIIEMPQASSTAIVFVEFLKKLVEFAKKSDKTKNEFYASSNLIVMSQGINTLLQICCDRNRDLVLRNSCLSLLSSILLDCAPSRLATVSTVVPGVLSKMFQLITKNSNENADLLEKSIEFFGDCVVEVLSDSSFSSSEFLSNPDDDIETPDGIKKMIVDRKSVEWRKETTKNVQTYITVVCSSSLSHRLSSVRIKTIEMLQKIETECQMTFQESLFPVIIDVYLLMAQDSEVQVNSIDSLLKVVTDKNRIYLEKRLYDKLDELIVQLPTSTRSRNAENVLKMLTSVISGLGDSVSVLCTSRASPIISLIRSLGDSIKIDIKKVLITKAEKAKNLEDFLQKYPLMFDVKQKVIQKLMRVFVRNGGCEVIGILYSEMLQSSMNQKCTYALLISYCLLENPQTEDKSIFFLIGEYFIQLIEQLFDKRVKREDVIEDLSYEDNADCCLESLICVNLALFVDYYDEDQKTKSKRLIDTLYTLFFECQSTSWIIQEASNFAISNLATTSAADVRKEESDSCPIISLYGGYIVHRISLACSSSSDHHFAPLVFQSFLCRCEDPQFFENSVHIVKKLLDALDRYEQKSTIAILNALKDFVTTVNRWFPEIRPIEKSTSTENGHDDEKPLPTQQMIIVEKILNRTKHFLTSSLLPIRIVTLEIVYQSLYSLRYFDDLLLPMVHQNWQSLMTIMRYSEPVAIISALRVSKQMARVSKSFVQQRVMKELWPQLEKFGEEEIRKRNFYTQTANFKLVREIIESFPEMCIFCEVNQQQIECSILPFLEKFIETNNAEIVKICNREKTKLEKYYGFRKNMISAVS